MPFRFFNQLDAFLIFLLVQQHSVDVDRLKHRIMFYLLIFFPLQPHAEDLWRYWKRTLKCSKLAMSLRNCTLLRSTSALSTSVICVFVCVYAWIRLKPYVIIYTIESIQYSLFEEFFHVVQFLPEAHVTAQGQCSGYGNTVKLRLF